MLNFSFFFFFFNCSKFLKLWQISDGKQFYQIIYSSNQNIEDCDYVRQRGAINHFFKQFYKEVNHAISTNQSETYTPQKYHLSEHEFREFVENGWIQSDFDDDLFPTNNDFGFIDDENRPFGFSNFTYRKINSILDVPNDLVQLLDLYRLKKKCNRRHREMKKLAHAISGTNETDRLEAAGQINR